MKKAAFTLVEVLIVIGVIGIVAAMTLPNMYTNFKKRQTVTGLQVAYSMFSQAIKQSVAENGEVATWDLSVDRTAVEKYINPYLSGTTLLKPYYKMHSMSNQYGVTGHNYDMWSGNMTYYPLYVTSKGMVFCYHTSRNPAYASIVVDINGPKKPNVMGIDGFHIYINKQDSSVILAGSELSRDILLGFKSGGNGVSTCVRDSTWQYYRGGYCGAVIQKDGWKISDDYPWGNGGLTPVEK